MRKIREILRLKYEAKLTNCQIAQSCNRARSTIANYLERAEKAGLRWPLPDELDEDKLHELLFADTLPPAPTRPLPDLAYVHKEVRRRHVTLQLLWEEYRTDQPDGYSYTAILRALQALESAPRGHSPATAPRRGEDLSGLGREDAELDESTERTGSARLPLRRRAGSQ